MTSQADLTPDRDRGTGFEDDLLARAFHLLLDDGRPVSPAGLAEAVVGDLDRVEDALGRLDRQGRLRRDPAAAVTGSHGLSVTQTPHELLLQDEPGRQRRYWTWCAYDAVGILAALGAGGRIRSTSPSAGKRIELDFVDGMPTGADPEVVVFFADTDCCGSGSVIDEWCPLVNFFEHAEAARAWAAERGVRGTAVPLAEATERGRAAWGRWIADGEQTVGPTGQAGSRP